MSVDKSIDPGRTGLSKSLMVGPCERKSFFGEVVRDAQGRRLRFPSNERMLFGSAVDAGVAYFAEQIIDGSPYDLAQACKEAMGNVTNRPGWMELEDKETFGIQVQNALTLYLQQDDGLKRLMPYMPGMRVQGDNGRSLTVEDIVGTPDFLALNGVIDVKTASRSYNETKFWQSAEMGVYAWLYTAENGALPKFLAYQVYVRTQKPKWQWLQIPSETTPDPNFAHLVELGRLHARRWRKGLEHRDPDLFSFSTEFCKDCPFARPIPEVGFEGCEVGMLMPQEEPTDAAA